MRGRFSRRSKILGIVLVALLVGLTVVLTRLGTHPSPWWAARAAWLVNRTWAESRGLRVEIDQLAGSPFTRVSLVNVRLERRVGGAIVVRADTVALEPNIFGFLKGDVALHALDLVGPDVRFSGWGEGEHAAREIPGSGGRSVEIHSLRISRGRLSGGPLGEGRSLDEVDLGGFVRLERDRFALRLDRASGRLSDPDLQVRMLTGWLTRRGSLLKPKLALETPRSSVKVRGEIHLGDGMPNRLTVGLHDLSVEEVRVLVPRIPGWAEGWISGALYFSGTRDEWETRVALQGKIGERPASSVRALVSFSGGTLAVPELSAEVGAGRVVSDQFQVRLDSKQFAGRLEVEGLNLADLVDDFEHETNLNWAASFSGEGIARVPERLRLDVDLGPSDVGRLALGGGRVSLESGREWLNVEEAVLSGPGWSASGSGRWQRAGDVGAEVVCEVESLEAIGRAVDRRLAGRGMIRGELGGRAGDLKGRAAVDLESVEIEGTAIDTLLADLMIEKREGPLRVSAFLDGRKISRGGLRGRKVVANVETSGPRVEEFQVVGQTDSLLVRLEGRMTDAEDVRVLSLSRAEISSTSRLWENDGDVEVVISPEGVELKPARWRCAGGTIEASAEVLAADDVTAVVEGNRVCLGAVTDLVFPGRNLDGTLDLRASLTGTLGRPRAEVAFTAHPLWMGPVEVDSLAAAFELGPDRLEVDSLSVVAGGGRGRVGGAVPVEFALGGQGGGRFKVLGLGEVGVRVVDLPLEDLARGASDRPAVAGRLNLEGFFSGGDDGARGRIDAHLEKARLGSFHLGRVDVLSRVHDRELVLEDIEITRGESSGRILGTVPLERIERFPWVGLGPSGLALEVTVERGPFTFLPSVHSSVFRESQGVYDLDVGITGSLADPALEGKLVVRDGRIVLGPFGEGIEDLEADVIFDGRLIRVGRLSGRLGGGPLRAEAQITLDSLRATDYWVKTWGERLEISSLLEDVSGVVDVDLLVRPDTTGFGTVAPHYSGTVRVHQAEITRDLGRSGEADESSLAGAVAPTWTADLLIEGANNIWLRNRDAEIELEGSVLMKKDSQGMRFLGDLETIRGRYFLYNNEFRITSGSLEFADVHDVRNARVEVMAETEVATEEGRERISLEITGTIAKPYLAATSESGYTEPEIFRLLALGDEGGDPDGGAASPFSRALARSWGRILARKFGTELARSLGLDEVEIEPGPGDIGDREFVEGARVGVGKYVSERLYLKYMQALAVNRLKGSGEGGTEGAVSRAEAELPDRQLILEYRLSRSFSLDGEASVLNGKPYFNFDVKFRHRY